MNHSGSLPPGQPGFPGQPQQQQQQQQQQQFAGYQQSHYPQQQQQQHFQQRNFGYPSQQVGGFGYDASFEQPAQPQAQPQFQAQNQWAYYNTGNGYGGGNGGMQMPAQEHYNMAPQGAWQQQQQQQQRRVPQATRPQQQMHQQQSYHVPSPQMQHAMNTQAHYGNQGQSHYHHQMQGQQMGHLQQPPRRSPSVSQQHQQMRQGLSPQVQHQPSPQTQARPSPQLQQQHFALNAATQQQQHPSYQQMQHHAPQQQQQQQQPAQVHTPTPPPLTTVQQQQPQVLQPQARPIQPISQPKPQPQHQVHVKPEPKPDPGLESVPTSFQGQSRVPGQVRPPVPAQMQNQIESRTHQTAATATGTVPSAQSHTQTQTQNHLNSNPPLEPTSTPSHPPSLTASSNLQQQQLQQDHAPSQTQMQFVNLQDIQAMPRQMAQSQLVAHAPVPQNAHPTKQQSLQPPASIKKERSPSDTPKLPTSGAPSSKKVEKASRKSVSQSPGTPSGRLSTSQSPAISAKKTPTSNASILTAAAEELIGKARSGASLIASGPQASQVEEYHKMISTGLACFEAALQGKSLTPRQEARVRLRYAAVLHEETENITDAETTLSKGITLCDRHRLHDLKYCLQFLMMKILFRRNRKASLKALDQHIADCETYKHTQWTYAFRLLKFSFYEESGNAADATSLENIRAIQSMASARGDVAMSVYASLTEALVMLKTSKATSEAIHNCLAQASKHQFDEQAKIPELELLSLLLDVTVGFNRDTHEVLDGRLHELKKRIGTSGVSQNGELLIPIKRPSSGAQTVSSETSAIIRPGNTQDPDQDHLVTKFMTEQQMAIIVFSMCGHHYLHKPHLAQHNTATLWQHGLRVLREYGNALTSSKKPNPLPLKQALEEKRWRTQTQCYLNILLGLLAASQCNWDAVQQFIAAVDEVAREGLEGPLKAYYYYLKGAYCQGTGELESALAYFQDESLSRLKKQNNSAVQQHLAILAGINRIWIMQRPEGGQDWPFENHALTRDLIEELEPLCSNHHVPEIRTAWWVVRSTAVQEPPVSRNTRKEFAHRALNTSKLSESVFGKLISIVGARDILYTNVLGDQAVKAIHAAGAFSNKSNNPLWQSVVFGIYADFSDTKNEREAAQKYFSQGVEKAKAAFHRSS